MSALLKQSRVKRREKHCHSGRSGEERRGKGRGRPVDIKQFCLPNPSYIHKIVFYSRRSTSKDHSRISFCDRKTVHGT